MLVLTQNHLRMLNVEEVILQIKGSPTNQEVEIKDINSPVSLATYYSKDLAQKVFNDFLLARQRLFALMYAKEILTSDEIQEIVKKDFIFVFPEDNFKSSRGANE